MLLILFIILLYCYILCNTINIIYNIMFYTINSVPHKIVEVIKNEGGQTKYLIFLCQ